MIARTGPVRVTGFGIKLRKAINSALKNYFQEKKLSVKKVNDVVSDINMKIYSVVVEKYKLPREAVINIVVDFDITGDTIVVKDVSVEVYDLNTILTKNITSDVKEKLSAR